MVTFRPHGPAFQFSSRPQITFHLSTQISTRHPERVEGDHITIIPRSNHSAPSNLRCANTKAHHSHEGVLISPHWMVIQQPARTEHHDETPMVPTGSIRLAKHTRILQDLSHLSHTGTTNIFFDHMAIFALLRGLARLYTDISLLIFPRTLEGT